MMKNSVISRPAITTMFALMFALLPTASVHAWQDGAESPFSAMYVFGDSLSDTGNFFALSGGFPEPPYFEGRNSNGILWVEYLAMELGISPIDFHNYAVNGATSGRGNYNDIPDLGIEFPGLHDEIDQFVAELNVERADEDALYIVWVGANDFFAEDFQPDKSIAKAIRNTTRAVRRLHAQGARHIMVINLPDLGLTPYGPLLQPAGILSYLSAVYNANLESALAKLAWAGVDTIPVDSSAALQDVVANPGNYPPLTNVTDAFLLTNPFGDPNEYLFWDLVHPTTTGHSIIADAAFATIAQNAP